jgi:ADP-ribose pyrophosphatase YjhB (NUDIX family)
LASLLQPFWRLTRGLTLGAQGLVVDADGRILLIRHTYRPGWHFPGGGVERGETVETALKRELAEEAGVIIMQRAELFGVYANARVFPGDHIALFIVRSWQQPARPEPNREIAEQGFFTRDAMPDTLNAATGRRLLEVFDRQTRDEIW